MKIYLKITKLKKKWLARLGVSLLLLSLTSCFTKEIVRAKSNFCDLYTPFKEDGFSKDVIDYADDLAGRIEQKEVSGRSMTAEEKLHKYFVDYSVANKLTAEKEECFLE
jgi:hypothetical protein